MRHRPSKKSGSGESESVENGETSTTTMSEGSSQPAAADNSSSSSKKAKKKNGNQTAPAGSSVPSVDEIFDKERKSISNSWPSAGKLVLLVLLITAAGFASRYWDLHEPNETVFDEVYFGSFTSSYVQRHYFFDIHPPLGKLGLAWAGTSPSCVPSDILNTFQHTGSLVNFNYTEASFREIGTQYPDDRYVVLRRFSAFFGSLLVPLTFLIVKVSCTLP